MTKTTIRFGLLAAALSVGSLGVLEAACVGADTSLAAVGEGRSDLADGSASEGSADANPASPPSDATTLSDAPVGPCLPAPAGLVSWFTGDITPKNGTGLLDTGKGGNDLLFDGATANGTLAPGMVGNAFLLGALAGLHRPQPNALLDNLTQLTIEAWIKPAKPGGELVTRFATASVDG